MSACVFFFGGYKASPNDMKVWVSSAQTQKPDVQFTAYPWPQGASSGAGSAVAGFTNSGEYKKAVDAIKASSASLIYVVGHSSGCAIANAVDKGLQDHTNIVLVALDGFTPDGKQLERQSTQVWGAECGKAGNTVKSMNYPGPAGGRRKVYQATNCKKKWPLHFSLVNENASDSTVKDPPHHLATGYANCKANLCWLP